MCAEKKIIFFIFFPLASCLFGSYGSGNGIDGGSDSPGSFFEYIVVHLTHEYIYYMCVFAPCSILHSLCRHVRRVLVFFMCFLCEVLLSLSRLSHVTFCNLHLECNALHVSLSVLLLSFSFFFLFRSDFSMGLRDSRCCRLEMGIPRESTDGHCSEKSKKKNN